MQPTVHVVLPYAAELDAHAILVATWTLAALLAGVTAARAQQPPSPPEWTYGAFADVARLTDSNAPPNNLFRNRGTTPRVDEIDLNMAGVYLKKAASQSSRLGLEFTVHGGEDAALFGFSSTAPNIGGADTLLHFGPTNASWLTSAGVTVQAGIFSSLIGYDSLYAKDNFNYTRPWGADYTPYLMLGANASYPATDRLTITGAVVNGYWHLAHANDAPSVAGQVAFKVNDAVTLKQTVLAGSHQPETSIARWRVLSDTILERKTSRFVTALEYQWASEQVAATDTRAQWMSAQAIVHGQIHGPWSATVRPEFAWDRDGRWIGAPQSVTAEHRSSVHRGPPRTPA